MPVDIKHYIDWLRLIELIPSDGSLSPSSLGAEKSPSHVKQRHVTKEQSNLTKQL